MADRRSTVRVVRESGPLGFLSLLAFLGALVYFVEQATDFWSVVLAVLEAFVWPAILVFHLLRVLHA
ncbi:MAG TPA: hypothetical protein VIG28_00680 [Leifsonia sp.]|jgi:hypothetical protein